MNKSLHPSSSFIEYRPSSLVYGVKRMIYVVFLHGTGVSGHQYKILLEKCTSFTKVRQNNAIKFVFPQLDDIESLSSNDSGRRDATFFPGNTTTTTTTSAILTRIPSKPSSKFILASGGIGVTESPGVEPWQSGVVRARARVAPVASVVAATTAAATTAAETPRKGGAEDRHGHRLAPSWFRIKFYGQELRKDEDTFGIITARNAIHRFLDHALQNTDGLTDSSQIILAGYSQGGALAQYAALTYPKKLGGVVSISGWLPTCARNCSLLSNKFLPTEESLDTPFLLCHGLKDAVVPIALADEATQCIKSQGVKDVRLNRYGNFEHTFLPEEVALDFGNFILDKFDRLLLLAEQKEDDYGVNPK